MAHDLSSLEPKIKTRWHAAKKFRPARIGDLFINGATLLAQYQVEGYHVVLAHRDGAYHPYVTWIMGSKGELDYGHYFATKEEGLADFRKRIA